MLIVALALVLALSAIPVAAGPAAPAISEDFSASLGSDLEDADGAFTIASGAARKTIFYGLDERSYIRSVASNYGDNDFVAELTFTTTEIPGSDFVINYFGLGTGDQDIDPNTGLPSFFSESAGFSSDDTERTLKGTTTSGLPITATDSVRIVPKGK